MDCRDRHRRLNNWLERLTQHLLSKTRVSKLRLTFGRALDAEQRNRLDDLHVELANNLRAGVKEKLVELMERTDLKRLMDELDGYEAEAKRCGRQSSSCWRPTGQPDADTRLYGVQSYECYKRRLLHCHHALRQDMAALDGQLVEGRSALKQAMGLHHLRQEITEEVLARLPALTDCPI